MHILNVIVSSYTKASLDSKSSAKFIKILKSKDNLFILGITQAMSIIALNSKLIITKCKIFKYLQLLIKQELELHVWISEASCDSSDSDQILLVTLTVKDIISAQKQKYKRTL